MIAVPRREPPPRCKQRQLAPPIIPDEVGLFGTAMLA